jgi:hypothetical protein
MQIKSRKMRGGEAACENNQDCGEGMECNMSSAEHGYSFCEEKTVGGKSSRKPRTVKSARVTPVKTSRTYKGKDGVTRVLYKRGLDFYVKKKSEKTGKFTYRKVKV